VPALAFWPRVAEMAAERHAFETTLHAVIERSGLAQADDAWDEMHPAPADAGSVCGSTRLAETVRTMPYDLSPARLRCMELAMELDGLGTA
jgi:hypothetical protein